MKKAFNLLIKLQSPLKVKTFAILLLLTLAYLPGSHAVFLYGLPLNQWGILWLVSLGIFLWTTPWHTIRILKLSILSTLILLCLAQLFYARNIPYGWSICLQRGSNSTTIPLTTPCEKSVSHQDGSLSYIYPSISFRNNTIPLYFMNDVFAFNYWESDQPSRYTLPYSFKAQTNLLVDRDTSINISSNIKAIVTIDGKAHMQSVSGSQSYPVAKGWHTVQVSYTASRSETDTLSISTPSAQPYYADANNQNPYKILLFKGMFYFLLSILTISVVTSAILSLRIIGNKKTISIMVALFLLGCAAVIRWPLELGRYSSTYLLYFIFVVTTTLLLANKEGRKSVRFGWLFFLIFLSTYLFTFHTTPPGQLIIFSGGNDELTHEGFSRLVFLSEKLDILAGGEGRFYYQPLYRYLLAVLHIFFGEAMFGPYLIQTLFMGLAISYTIRFLKQFIGNSGVWIFIILTGYMCFKRSSSLFLLTQMGFQQALATPFLLLAISLSLLAYTNNNGSKVLHFFVGLLLGTSIMMRTDYLPLFVGWIFYFYFSRLSLPQGFWQRTSCFLVGFILAPLFIVLRTFYLTQTVQVFPDSSLVNIIPDFYFIYPYKGEPSTVSGIQVIFTVISRFHGHYIELAKILLGNIYLRFIGTTIFRQVLWFNVPALTIIAFLNGSAALRKIIIIIATLLIPSIIASSFYWPHNGNAMLAHYDYLIIVLISVSAGFLLRPIFNKEKQHA